MKTLGYYNGKYGELEEMSIPMNDRVCWFEMVFMMQVHPEIIKYLR